MSSGRFDRQGFLGPNSGRVFDGLRVAIVGLGGGGSHISQHLAHIGVGNPRVLDPQVIEDTNLNRLVGGTEADVKSGTPKVEIAGRLIRAVNAGIRVIEVQEKWQKRADILQACHFIFGCVDSFSERDQLERLARRFLVPYIDIGMDVHRVGETFVVSGQVALSLPDSPCLWCMGLLTEKRLEEEARRYGDAGGKPQVIWPNGTLASTAVGIFVNLVCPWQGGFDPALLWEYDGNRHIVAESNKVPTLRRMKCRHHDGSLGDPFWGRSVMVAAAAS
jgi:hypothetical protein